MTRNYPKKTIYLAGPITGLTHDEARFGWRKELASILPEHIFCSSPMRGKEYLAEFGVLGSDQNLYADHVMSTASGVTTRDYNDVRNCDAMVACFLESENRPSLGTAAEYGYAWSHHIPIIAVGPADEINVSHLMLARMAGYRMDTLEEAAVITTQLLTPGI